MLDNNPDDFYAVQRRQWRLTLVLTSVLFLFYFALVGFLVLLVSTGVGIIRGLSPVLTGEGLVRSLIITLVTALGLAVFHYLDARQSGAKFILDRLGGRVPDPRDRYHLQFLNTVDEIRIAAGLPRVQGFGLPTLAINALALIQADKTPAVVVTEGLLSESTRDELEAAVAHELAHIVRGDTFFITLVCSLANVFERVTQALDRHADDDEPGAALRRPAYAPFFLALAAGLSAVVMRLLSTLISRQREILADAAAVELCRAPMSLARILYKAHLKNTFVGDFSLTYSPLFMVSADPMSENEGFWGRLLSTHPPLMSRIERLAGMAHKAPAAVIEEVWDFQKNRQDHRRVLVSEEEYQKELRDWRETGELADKVWLIRDDQEKWIGPLSLNELLLNPYFLMSRRVKNLQERVEAQAGEFEAVREAVRREQQKKPPTGSGRNLCPRCRVPLGDFYYEGVAVKVCRQCLGKLVDTQAMERILARREFTFSSELVKKAEDFKQQFLTNPIKAQKQKDKESPPVFCPSCGYRMVARPYNYQFFLPVEKCLSCAKVWFDADELEMLQVLIEKD